MKGFTMKLLFALITSLAVLSAQAQATAKPAEPATTEAPKSELKLAKKKADKDAEAKAAKDATKSAPAGDKKTEAPKK